MTEQALIEGEDLLTRARTLRLLRGREAWPLGIILPVKRFTGEDFELGYVRQENGIAIALVYTDEGPVTRRRYHDFAQLLDAGWRAD